uniref:SERTA domain-containing protein n=1 Tax=Setaria digitata TaxID=48799 RepID=A0A915PNS7_9BILA
MILLVGVSQSSSSSSSEGQEPVNRSYDLVDHALSSPALPLNTNILVGSSLTSDNNTSFFNYRQPSLELEQSWSGTRILDSIWLQFSKLVMVFCSSLDEVGVEMDSEDDGYLNNSSIHSTGSSTFKTSPVMPYETGSLNERRRAILDLSISKIHTMNTSNVAVSLRKSLLIYNTMKSLQRDLDACDVFVCGSLIEKENEIVANDVEMLEANEVEEGNWEQQVSDLSCDIRSDNNSCNQHLGYDWPWGTLVNTASKDTMQGSEKYDSGDVFTLTSSNDLFNTGNNWNSNTLDATDSSAFIDDYLGMLCAWEDENYNPLTNCNLTRAEIMNMFHLPSYHLNNQLVSQA